nr:S9 family peptidase [Renibacterium salmoninarum]
MKPSHLPLIRTVSAPTLHPEGVTAIVAVSRADFDADSYVGQLWQFSTDDSSSPRRFTRGFRDSAPQYSPDGAVLAFMRSAPGKAGQIHIVDARGGEPQTITDRKLSVNEFSWSPGGNQIVFAAAVPEEGRYGTIDGVGASAEDPRLITSYKYRMNGAGFTQDQLSQIFTVDVPSVDAEPLVEPQGRAKKQAEGGKSFKAVPEAVQLTKDAAEHSNPRFSADGLSIYYLAEPLDSVDLLTELWQLPVGGDQPKQLERVSQPGLSFYGSIESADGRWLFALGSETGSEGKDFVGVQGGVYVRALDGSSDWTRLTDDREQDFGDSAPLTRSGADSVLAIERHRGAERLWQIKADGTAALLLDNQSVVSAAAQQNGSTVVSFTNGQSFGDLAVIETDGVVRSLSDFSAEFRKEAGVIAAQEHVFESKDGYPVHGWVLLPEGDGPHPVLLNIHGGPFAQYGWGIFDEVQVYADAGYAVVMCNPRGSGSYGYEHGRAVKEAFGTVDLDDVLGFLEGSLATYSQLDAERLGVMGGSYGGYLTAWTISQDHRFKAAIVERGFLDPVSFVGSSDIGWMFPDEYNGIDPEKIAAQSPMAQIDKVRTPALVIHSEEDWRCPIEQGQRYFVELKRRGIETELLIFSGESHELSRSGLPHHRKQRFEHILRWWAKYLPTAKNS